MRRAIAVLGILVGTAGCGDPGGAREVPVSGVRDAGAGLWSDNHAVTKDGRAIATH